MSYILDALKRADAERERGQVPGLHSQTAHAPAQGADTATEHPRRAAPRLMWWASGGLALAAALAMGFWWSRGVTTPLANGQRTATAVRPPLVEPGLTTPAPVTTQPPPVRPSEPAPPILAPQPLPSPPLAPATPVPVPAAAPKAEVKVESKVLPFGSLSAEQRSRLPQLNISGASYSDNPAHRLLIVNGQVLQEGQEIAPGLVLERIGPHEAVLNQRGLRLSIGY